MLYHFFISFSSSCSIFPPKFSLTFPLWKQAQSNGIFNRIHFHSNCSILTPSDQRQCAEWYQNTVQ